MMLENGTKDESGAGEGAAHRYTCTQIYIFQKIFNILVKTILIVRQQGCLRTWVPVPYQNFVVSSMICLSCVSCAS